jgi:hypothetical protein
LIGAGAGALKLRLELVQSISQIRDYLPQRSNLKAVGGIGHGLDSVHLSKTNPLQTLHFSL